MGLPVGAAAGAQLGASLTFYALTYAALLIAYFVVVTHLAASGDESAPGPSPSKGKPRAAGAE